MAKDKKKVTLFTTVLIAILVVLIGVSGFKIFEALNGKSDAQGELDHNTKTVTVDGVDYFPRQDITVLMLMGIDEFGEVKKTKSYNNTGECDMVALAVFDEQDKTYSVLALNRDTMMDIYTLGVTGQPSGTIFGQLALAHTFGTGMEDSCEIAVRTVSDFLSGLTVDYYLSMNMDAIAILNDAVGGVTVNVVDDFSGVDSTIPMGEVTLSGEQALSYVQTRKDVSDEMNISRMERHKEYMENFVAAFSSKVKESDTFVLETYNEIAPYIVSDCSINSMSAMLNRYADYTLRDVVTPAGETVLTEQYVEFYADEAELEKLILNMFYTKK